MGLKLKLSTETKLTTRLSLTPRLELALKLLKMTSLELEERIEAEVLANPVLELALPEEGQEKAQDAQDRGELREFMDYLFSNDLPEASFHLYEPEASARPEQPSEPSLLEYLTFQIHSLGFSEEEARFAEILAGNLDERGYLGIPLEEAASEAGMPLERAEGILEALQKLEPSGIFAKDLKDCLHIQLTEMGLEGTLADRLVLEHHEDIKKPDPKLIARKFCVDEDEARRSLALIAKLDPAPAKRIEPSKASLVFPDVVMTKLGQDYIVTINRPFSSRLRISPSYRSLLANPDTLDREAVGYLRKRVSSALWFARSVQQRETTLYKVATVLARLQRDFLDFGLEGLKPLMLKDVALEVGIHESTVSRAIAGKYAQTPQGLVALKSFFSHALPERDGAGVAAKTLKALIWEIVHHEPKNRPLSDIVIAKRLLETKGITVARRTIAKYRKEMGLRASSSRKD